MTPRSRTERLKMRAQVWRWLVIFSCWQIIGLRKGAYRDRDTGRLLDLRSESPLFHIDRREYAVGEQMALDDSTVPVEVTLLRGTWLNQWARDDRILNYFGNVRKLADIPGGQPTGAWARAIGMALFQFWREEVSRVSVVPVGDERTLTARYRLFSRRELLDTFPPEPSVDDILHGANPKRAVTYYKGAIAFLRKGRVIGYYQEPPPPSDRQGWGRAWLDQKVEARPVAEDMKDVALMAARAEAGRKARTRKKKVSA
jgi:hypothetical protein